MKRYYITASLVMIAAMVAASFYSEGVSAQGRMSNAGTKDQGVTSRTSSIFVEDFNYAPGALLVDNGWVAHSGAGTNSLAAVSPGLTYSGWASSGVGNAVGMTTSGEDANHPFSVQTSGSVYYGAMVNISEAATDAIGGYFIHFGPDPIGTTFRARVFVKKDASNNVSFGITKASTSTAADITYTPFSYALNTTYLIVVKYTIVAGATNDTVDLFINPALGGSEPAATVSATDVGGTDINPGTISLRQGSTATSPTLKVDGIRVANSWSSLQTAQPMQHVVDFNGDGKTDYTVVRNTGGGPTGQITWFTCTNGVAEPGCSTATPWGLTGDFFMPSDYDGDGKTDIAVWRSGAAGSAYFYILQSSDNVVRADNFGQAGDNPSIVDDYDGDGKADVAVYRAGANSGDQSYFYYRQSAAGPSQGQIIYTPWGQNGDFVAPGDFDGDGKADFVIQRNAGGGQAVFWMYSATGTISYFVFGTPTDVIVPGDYNGDGKTDIATVRGSGGSILWNIKYSPFTNATAPAPDLSFPWGNSATDVLAQGDYDGDGKTEAAVWRPNADPTMNYFYALNPTSGGTIFKEWGQNGDSPVARYNSH